MYGRLLATLAGILLAVMLGFLIPKVAGIGTRPGIPDPTTSVVPVESPAPEPQVRPQSLDYTPFLQLSSHRTLDKARKAVVIHNRVLPKYVGERHRALKVYRVEIASGTWYRVVMPTSSFKAAQDLCSRMKSDGLDCLATYFTA